LQSTQLTIQSDPSNGLPRVLVVHNAYQQRGGEDAVVEAEVELLRSKGHSVELYSRHNEEIPALGKLSVAGQTLWSRKAMLEVGQLIERFRPAVMHVHNTFPLMSPSIYWEGSRQGIPVIQTLHNFRLVCAQGMLLRNGKICEDCLGTLPWRGVLHRCYRQSTTQTAALVSMLALHRGLRTYSRKVARYIALNEFCRDKFIEGGLPADRIEIKPNFVDLSAPVEGARNGGLFVGRLAPEKGLITLIEALHRTPGLTIDVIGNGPLEGEVRACPQMRWLGWLPAEAVYGHMRKAAYLVMPSLWYENFPRTLVEAFACGLPVVATRVGALAELVEDGRTGILFETASAPDLAEALKRMESNPGFVRQLGRAALLEYEAKYTPDANYRTLMQIYRNAESNGSERHLRLMKE
jgi:glycosyltransferase involved in cell wall biosynthesis